MTRTSIGFHTFTIFIRIIGGKNMKKIFREFENYRSETKAIDIYIPKDEKDRMNDIREIRAITGMNKSPKPRKWRIDYTHDDRKGITWFLKYDIHSTEYKEYIIEARINPKILAGIKDYITASDSSYMKMVEKRFNDEARKISKDLGEFSNYKLKRVDFCVNFDLKELGIKCIPQQMMTLYTIKGEVKNPE